MHNRFLAPGLAGAWFFLLCACIASPKGLGTDGGGVDLRMGDTASPTLDYGERSDAAGTDADSAPADLGAGSGPDGPPVGPKDQGTDAASICGAKTSADLVWIPVRDGASLAAYVRYSVDPSCKLPTIYVSTPYDRLRIKTEMVESSEAMPLFISPHYNLVVVDWRGSFGSANAPVEKSNAAQQRAEDAYDIIAWIAKQPYGDGKVAMWGASALGFSQFQAATQKPPQLKAIVPIFSHLNFGYEQFMPGGVEREEYVEVLSLLFGAFKPILALMPYYTKFWSDLELTYSAKDILVPTLVVGGWYDIYNTPTFRSFDQLVKDSPTSAKHRLLIGAWSHYASGSKKILSGKTMTAEEIKYYDSQFKIQQDSLDFFDLHLRGVQGPAANWPKVRFVWAAENTWDSSSSWPPASQLQSYYLQPGGGLGSTAPSAAKVTFPFDPKDPSPTIGGNILNTLPSYGLIIGPTDMGPVLARPDARAFTSAPLAKPLRVAGAIAVELDVETTGQDTDFAVRLTDVDAQGKQLLIGDGIRRLKLRDTLAAPSPTEPNTRYQLTATLTNELAYTFGAGHRIGLIITSSNYPRFARNPNTGSNTYNPQGVSLAVTNTIYFGAQSRLRLPVVPTP
jgi:predicted acyl esterase